MRRRDSGRECDNRCGSAGQGRARDGVQVGDPALTVIQADLRHDLLTPADDHRSPPLEVEEPQGNASGEAEAVHDPPGDGLGAANSRHGGKPITTRNPATSGSSRAISP